MNVRLQYPFTFTAGVYYDGQLKMNNYSAKVWLITNTLDPANHNTAFERLKHFIYTELDSTIFINSEYTEQCEAYARAGLNITTMPDEPVDQLVGIMLYYKLNAIMEDRITVLEVEVSSVLGDGMIYMHAENESTDLPNVPAWWSEPDLTHCERDLIGSDKVVSLHHAGAWRELDLAWPDADDVVENNNTIVFADFGKDDTK